MTTFLNITIFLATFIFLAVRQWKEDKKFTATTLLINILVSLALTLLGVLLSMAWTDAISDEKKIGDNVYGIIALLVIIYFVVKGLRKRMSK